MCFADQIGIRGTDCQNATSDTGLYIDDINGVSLNLADKLHGREFKNGQELLQRCIDVAIQQVKAKAGPELNKFVRISPLVVVDSAGQFRFTGVTATDYNAAEAATGGIEICISEDLYDNMGRIYISKIKARANSTVASKQITITDRDGSTTYTGNLTAGQTLSYDVYTEFKGSRITITWDLSDVAYNDSSMHIGSNCSNCGSTNTYKSYPMGVIARGIKGTTNYACTFGLSAEFSVQCSTDDMLCSMLPSLKHILWKEAGLQFVRYALTHPERWNETANMGMDSMKAAEAQLLVDLYGIEEMHLRAQNRSRTGLWGAFAQNAARAIKRFGKPCVTCNTATIKAARM